jgi:hypothetical protein
MAGLGLERADVGRALQPLGIVAWVVRKRTPQRDQHDADLAQKCVEFFVALAVLAPPGRRDAPALIV